MSGSYVPQASGPRSVPYPFHGARMQPGRPPIRYPAWHTPIPPGMPPLRDQSSEEYTQIEPEKPPIRYRPLPGYMPGVGGAPQVPGGLERPGAAIPSTGKAEKEAEAPGILEISRSSTSKKPIPELPKRPRGRPRKTLDSDSVSVLRTVSAGHAGHDGVLPAKTEGELRMTEPEASPSKSKKKKRDSEAANPMGPRQPSNTEDDQDEMTAPASTKKSPKKSSGQSQTWKVASTPQTSLGLQNLHLPPTSAYPVYREKAVLTPRIWALDKTELLAAIPVLGPPRCVNGVSWAHTRAPLVLLDDSTKASTRNAEIVQVPTGVDNTRIFDLFLTRALHSTGASSKINSAPVFKPSGLTERAPVAFSNSTPGSTKPVKGHSTRKAPPRGTFVDDPWAIPSDDFIESKEQAFVGTGFPPDGSGTLSEHLLQEIYSMVSGMNGRVIRLEEEVKQGMKVSTRKLDWLIEMVGRHEFVPRFEDEDVEEEEAEGMLGRGVVHTLESTREDVPTTPIGFSDAITDDPLDSTMGFETLSMQTDEPEMRLAGRHEAPSSAGQVEDASSDQSLPLPFTRSPFDGSRPKCKTLPCRCHKRWVYQNCELHAVKEPVPELDQAETESAEQDDFPRSKGRPKRKAAMKVQENAKKRLRRSPKPEGWHDEEGLDRKIELVENVWNDAEPRSDPESPSSPAFSAEDEEVVKVNLLEKRFSRKEKGKGKMVDEFTWTSTRKADELNLGKRKRASGAGDSGSMAVARIAHLGAPSMGYKRNASSFFADDPNPSGAGPSYSVKAEMAKTTTVGKETALTPLPSLPSEIRALIDAFISDMPLVIFASRSRILELLAASTLHLDVPEACGFACMGFFRIIGLEETMLPVVQLRNEKVPALASAQWKFRIEWVKGGEDIRRGTFDLSRPWWDGPPRALSIAQEFPSVSQASSYTNPRTVEGASNAVSPRYWDIDTPLLYRQLRSVYGPSGIFVANSYLSLIPESLMSEFNAFLSNDSFPSGWYCGACGKINFQAAMRHRKCTSSQCFEEGKPGISYAQDLADIRGAHSGSPSCLPFNDYPQSVLGKSTMWDNGMRTLSYYFDTHGGKRQVWAKHVFTCNLPHLQNKASEMIMELQTAVELKRPIGDPLSSFFTHSQDLVVSGIGKGVHNPLDAAGKFLKTRASVYAEIPPGKIEVSRLDILAWITPGTKKEQGVVLAKEKAVAVMCLGCDVVLCLTPKGVGDMKNIPRKFSKKGKEVEVDTGGLRSLDHLEDGVPDFTGAEEHEEHATEKELIPAASSSHLPPVTPSLTVRVSMVHGDVLVLYGDEFAYSLKRSGTGILLFGLKGTEGRLK